MGFEFRVYTLKRGGCRNALRCERPIPGSPKKALFQYFVIQSSFGIPSSFGIQSSCTWGHRIWIWSPLRSYLQVQIPHVRLLQVAGCRILSQGRLNNPKADFKSHPASMFQHNLLWPLDGPMSLKGSLKGPLHAMVQLPGRLLQFVQLPKFLRNP